MPDDSNTNILTLSNIQAKELAGRAVSIGMETYLFKDYDRQHPGQPPWRSGAEGKAYPLLDHDREVSAYLKFFTHATQKRLDRTAWLIGQHLHLWLPNLAAAPLAWVDTRRAQRSESNDLDFSGYLARAVPGRTWLEVKQSIADHSVVFPAPMRRRCLCDLVLALAVLEQHGIIHGDLSPNNIVIDLDAPPDRPALYLIDFDAFVASVAEANARVTVGEGGTYGTEGYCPPDLLTDAAEGDSTAAPYSDRYGRDMLLLELLAIDDKLPAEDPPATWSRERIEHGLANCHSVADREIKQSLTHLDQLDLFALKEQDRPASGEITERLGLSLPPKQTLRRTPRVWGITPAVLVPREAEATAPAPFWPSSGGSRRPAPATLNFTVPWRWGRKKTRTWWQDIRPVMGCLMPLLLLFLIAFGVFIHNQFFPR